MFESLEYIDKIRLINFGIVVFAASVLVLLERIFPYNKGQKFFREGFFNDFVLYNFLQSFILGIIISYIIQFLDGITQLSEFRLISRWPVWVQVIFFVITHDFYIYWFHRWQHKNKYLWRIHEAHHSTFSVDWLSGVRSHSLEILINQTVEFAPIILLGAAPEVAVYKGTISAVWGMYIHSNIDVKSGWLQYFINGPEMHRWHHSDDETDTETGVYDYRDKNFSTKLAIWDWIFGTAYKPSQKKSEIYGLRDMDFPKNYFRQHFFAFRRFKQPEP
ncbi:MAG: sterol desaturase family protein [Chlorobi bacterium]|nr:sterol desaturase family protein [Chlorobiota bacterium]MCI0715056.1 sterol desaturase family protein [Chlorobiota bacterium]